MIALCPKHMYHVICHRLAYATLPDGSNAHKTVQPPDWWYDKIVSCTVEEGYIVEFTNQGHEAGYFEILLK